MAVPFAEFTTEAPIVVAIEPETRAPELDGKATIATAAIAIAHDSGRVGTCRVTPTRRPLLLSIAGRDLDVIAAVPPISRAPLSDPEK